MIETTLELLQQNQLSKVREILLEMNPVDIAEVFLSIESQENIVKLYRILPKEEAAEAFAYMEPETQELLIHAFTDNELRGVLDELYVDDTIDMLEEMPASVVKRILQVSDVGSRIVLNRLLRYEEDTAGALMTTEFLDLKKQMTVQESFNRIRRFGAELETINICYVTNQNRVLEGVLTVRELLLNSYETRVEDIMETNVISAKTNDDQEQIAMIFQRYDILSVPVVDSENRLVGIITVDDIVDVIQEENTEDFEKMAAILPNEDTYLKTSAFSHAKNRIIWLTILMITATVTGKIINHYESAFSALPLLVSFIPMIMDTGGNCGNQASTLAIRGMALNEIRLRDWPKVICKELSVAAMVGAGLAVLNTLWILLLYKELLVAVTVGITIFFTVFIAKAIGCSLPMLAKCCGLDPAIMASPMITTIVDACAIMLYFQIALRLLPI